MKKINKKYQNIIILFFLFILSLNTILKINKNINIIIYNNIKKNHEVDKYFKVNYIKNIFIKNNKLYMNLNNKKWNIVFYQNSKIGLFDFDLLNNPDYFKKDHKSFFTYHLNIDIYFLRRSIFTKEYYVFSFYFIIKFFNSNKIVKKTINIEIDNKNSILYLKPYYYKEIFINNKINKVTLIKNYKIKKLNYFTYNIHEKCYPFFILNQLKLLNIYSKETVEKLINDILKQVYINKKNLWRLSKDEKPKNLFIYYYFE